jgi:His-Xaa-Ser system protein HxsD
MAESAESEETINVEAAKGEALLRIDSRLFSREAVLRALYWFSRDLYSEVSLSDNQAHLLVRLRLKQLVPTLENPKPADLQTLIAEFQTALVDSELRVQIQRETAGVRELILAKAFSEAGVLEDAPPENYEDPVLASRPKETTASLLKILS